MIFRILRWVPTHHVPALCILRNAADIAGSNGIRAIIVSYGTRGKASWKVCQQKDIHFSKAFEELLGVAYVFCKADSSPITVCFISSTFFILFPLPIAPTESRPGIDNIDKSLRVALGAEVFRFAKRMASREFQPVPGCSRRPKEPKPARQYNLF